MTPAQKLNATGKIFLFVALIFFHGLAHIANADSVNSPNITLNVDTNRIGGNGAGNVSFVVNTITIAETSLGEYSAGTGKAITVKARPGFQFDPSSAVSAVSALIGINGGAANVAASVTPSGSAEETLTFNLTSALAASSTTQDIIRINGIRLRILNAAGAAGPAQTTLSFSSNTAGGAFTDQGIVAASITRGAADHLTFSAQPTNTAAGDDLLPIVRIVDFGGNTVINDLRTITLAIQTNPGSATLLGTAARATSTGLAAWEAADHLRINTTAVGYTFRASHSGAAFLTSDTVDSTPFEISSGAPGGLEFTTQPVDTVAGENILVEVTILDNFGNVATSSSAAVTLDAAVNPGQWPILTSSSLTKNAVNGVVTWDASDELRITKAVEGYRFVVSGVGAPILSDPFDIATGTPELVRFVQQPETGRARFALDPALSVEIVDLFGNRTATDAAVSLELISAPCGGNITGNSANAVAGFATFPNVKISKACEEDVLGAAVSGLVAAASDPFKVTSQDSAPIAVNVLELHPGQNARFVSRGAVTIPSGNKNDPTVRGAMLTFSGTSAAANFSLPKKGWSKLRDRRRRTVGFEFSGRKVRGNKCKKVTIRKNLIQANCTLGQGIFVLPEAGPVDLELKLGKGSARFCGECGGSAVGDATESFTRLNCEAPTVCQ